MVTLPLCSGGGQGWEAPLQPSLPVLGMEVSVSSCQEGSNAAHQKSPPSSCAHHLPWLHRCPQQGNHKPHTEQELPKGIGTKSRKATALLSLNLDTEK